MVGAINKLYGKTWELNGATYENGIFTFPANGFAMATCSMPNPIPNHVYYGGVEQKAPSGASFDDGRFEWWKGDVAGELMVFAYMDGTNDQWVRQSAVFRAEADTSGSWIMRNFTVNGTAEAYRRNPIIIDLTEAFGAGNEPSAAWVDANMIPSANGDTIFFDVPSTKNDVEDRRRMMLAASSGGFTVSVIDGNGNSFNKRSYVSHNGVKYIVGQTFKCKKNDVIFCYLYGNWNGCQILLNGTVVATASNPTYSLTVTSDVNVTVAYKGYGDARMNIVTV